MIGSTVTILRGKWLGWKGILIDDYYRKRDDGSHTVLVQFNGQEVELNSEDVKARDG